MNISDMITDNSASKPNNRAIVCGDDGREITWAELDRLVNKFGNALINLGVEKGDIVAIYLPNSPEFIIAYFAIARIGAIVLPFNIIFKTGEIEYILNNSGARVLVGAADELEKNVISERNLFPALEKIVSVGRPLEGTADYYSIVYNASEYLEPADCSCRDLVTLVYTSGTSGHPKGAMLSYGNLISLATLNVRILHINDQDLLFAAPPFCHIAIVVEVLGPFCAGAGIIMVKHFDAKTCLDLISRYQVTHVVGVPTMYLYMLRAYDCKKHDLRSLRLAFSSGGPMPMECIQEMEEKFGIDFCEQYGTTETSSIITYNRMGHRRIGSVGKAACGIGIKIVDEAGNELPPDEVGEILVKGPGNFKGYWKMPEATQDAFMGDWYRTGDLGKLDSDKYLYIVDRLKDMIVSCGYNVYPREVEEIIYENPKILEAAVVGVKDKIRQEVPKAYIRLKDNEEMSDKEFIDFCSGRMAPYKIPRIIEFVEELPKGPTGKILKRMLQAINN